jgi:hypothetical protein
MEKYSKTIKNCLLIAGIIQIAMGLGHFIMPELIYKSDGFQHLNSFEIDIVTLCVFSVGILLIAIGLISILCATIYDKYKEVALKITYVILCLWLVRILFEIILPIKITLISINNPTIYVLPIFMILWILIALAVSLMHKESAIMKSFNQ